MQIPCCHSHKMAIYFIHEDGCFRNILIMRLTEKQVLERLFNPLYGSEPLRLEALMEQPERLGAFCPDALAEVLLENEPCFEAAVEIVTQATPKAILEKSRRLSDYIQKLGRSELVPLIAAPYIGARQARILADMGISWIDLSGNMIIRVPGLIYVERTGKKNKFPDTTPIRKIFEGTSSLVSRSLLLKPEGFSSQYEIADFINSRDGNITVSTVSRVLKTLEEELLVNKSRKRICASDREKLLVRLADGYSIWSRRRDWERYRFSAETLGDFFSQEQGVDCIACGFYAAQLKGLATTDESTVFVNDIEKAKRAFDKTGSAKIIPDAEYGNFVIIESRDRCAWFNADSQITPATVDDVELYLEMTVDTPRGPKIAEQLKERILKRQSNE